MCALAKRGAGLLLHITSLPSAFGIGDMGMEAFKFADFLHRSGMKYWQLLPLTATDDSSGYSPYSALSSMAGNIEIISPELIADDGLIDRQSLNKLRIPVSSKADFASAARVRRIILKTAFANFKNGANFTLTREFVAFCKAEKHWLSDYALYRAVHLDLNLPWYKWPESAKQRDKQSILALETKYEIAIQEQKWYQFIFDRQWSRLKTYCNTRGISIIGDLPFYVNHDSSDVWIAPSLFSVHKNGSLKSVAGVPPDYFNSDGQRWGMPVFNWERMKEDNFRWWISRLLRNKKLYDVIRLDHFRAFASFWDIPANSKSAKNGNWKKAAGAELFTALQRELGCDSLIAEDLGDIDQSVIELRDRFDLPGMKILQFAFDDASGTSSFLPSNFESGNFVVYSGTHDNNTTVGWFKNDLTAGIRKRISAYAGYPATTATIHRLIRKLAFASVAQTAIIPVQDVLGLDTNCRMNTPSTTRDNWTWRLLPKQLTVDIQKELKSDCVAYNR